VVKRVATITGTSTDTQTMNFDLIAAPGVITVYSPKHRQNFVIADGKLILRNIAEPGIIRLFNLKGELVFARSFPARASASIALDRALLFGGTPSNLFFYFRLFFILSRHRYSALRSATSRGSFHGYRSNRLGT
jgi:hypothetical protein